MNIPVEIIILLLIAQLIINFTLAQNRKEKDGSIYRSRNVLFWSATILNLFFAFTLVNRIYKINEIDTDQIELNNQIDTLNQNLLIAKKENLHLKEAQKKSDSLLTNVSTQFNEQAITLTYSEMATINCHGLKAQPTESGAFTSQYLNLYTKMRKCIDSKEPIPHLIRSEETLIFLNEIVREFPDFPFSYYYLGEYYFKSDKKKSNKLFKKASDILERTIQVPGHKKEHDFFYKNLKNNY